MTCKWLGFKLVKKINRPQPILLITMKGLKYIGSRKDY